MSYIDSPKTLAQYRGQDKIKKKLHVHITAAKMRGEILDHTIIHGNSGLGKTTIANIIGNEMGANIRTILCPSIKKVGELADVLMSIQENEILFLDEIHALNKKCMELLYPVMEKGILNAEVDGEQICAPLNPFTIIGATTDLGDLVEPLRNRFSITLELVPYQESHMIDIVTDNCASLGVEVEKDAAITIAKCSRGVPRRAGALVRCARDYAYVMNNGVIDEMVAEFALDEDGIDPETGLNQSDIHYLRVLGKDYAGKAVGIDLLSAATNMNKKTIETTIEPFLLQEGYVLRTPRGRKISKKGLEFIYTYTA